jgi:hypothetical protein
MIEFPRNRCAWVASGLALIVALTTVVEAVVDDKTDPSRELITVFWREKCTHCKKEREFLDTWPRWGSRCLWPLNDCTSFDGAARMRAAAF